MAWMSYNYTQFRIFMQLFDAYDRFFKVFAGIETLEIIAVRYQMSVSDQNYFDQSFDLRSVKLVLA